MRQLGRELQQLKATVLRQERRIEALERELRGRPAAGAAAPSVPAPAKASSGLSWQDRNAWGRVRLGMSEKEVTAILGAPTSVTGAGGYKALVFSGTVSGSGALSGNIQLEDGRVWQINTPVF